MSHIPPPINPDIRRENAIRALEAIAESPINTGWYDARALNVTIVASPNKQIFLGPEIVGPHIIQQVVHRETNQPAGFIGITLMLSNDDDSGVDAANRDFSLFGDNKQDNWLPISTTQLDLKFALIVRRTKTRYKIAVAPTGALTATSFWTLIFRR